MSNEMPVKVCMTENCYVVHPSAKRVCEFCGREFYPTRSNKQVDVVIRKKWDANLEQWVVVE